MKPFLSFVATSRNDNHGGNLNARTQAFITSLLEQAGRHRVPIELVIVEWNPPPERRKLVEQYDWSAINDYCCVRIITVPREIHARYMHANNLPLYQMIGKNVGIRRALGEFVAATNVDIIFDDDFFRKLTARGLQKAICYVANRFDVAQPFPYTVSLEEKLQYCRDHVIRINTRWGTKNLLTGDYAKIYSRYPPSVEMTRAMAEAAVDLTLLAIRTLGSCTKLMARVGAYQMLVRIPRPIKQLIAYGCGLSTKRMWKLDRLRSVKLRHTPAAMLTDWKRGIAARFASQGTHHAEHFTRIRGKRNLLRLQTNACGDLTIMDLQSWNLIHGYAEYDMFSMHIDGLACWAAHVAGIRQSVLKDVHIYHIEHAAGSGFTPEHQQQLWQRLTDQGIRYIDWRLLDDIIARLLEGSIDHRLSGKHWGLEGAVLPEVLISTKNKDPIITQGALSP